jgi:predicted aspartyl protease
MRIEKFKRTDAESLIILQCQLPNHAISLALDTGASHTTIDLTALLIAGFSTKNILRKEPIETAGGIVESFIFSIPSFTALGITLKNMEICAYDFLAQGVLSDFDGVLGLDFIEQHKICIDFIKSEIIIH